MITIVLKDKATKSYIGTTTVPRKAIRTLEQEFIVIKK